MALSEVTVSLNLKDKVGDVFDPRRTKAWTTTSVDVVHDTTGHQTRVGSGNATVGADGVVTWDVWIPGAGSNPIDWQTTFHVDFPDRNEPRGRKVLSFGPFTVTAAGWIDSLAEEQAVPPTYLTRVTAQLDTYVTEAKAARDQAVNISNISTSDGVMAAVQADPTSQFAIDQKATMVTLAKAPPATGGQHPKPFRVPTLGISRDWPNQTQDYTILWAQGLTAYAVAGDYSIRKSTDGGLSWTRKTTTAMTAQMGYRGGFLKTTANTLLAWENGSAGSPRIWRSTDDGATWTNVHTARAGLTILSAQSWCQDANTGYLYYGEYDPAGTQAEIRVYRSTDDGATWAQFSTAFPGLGGGTTATQVKHIHACQYDPVSQRVYVLVGDVSLSAGIYRVNSGGTALEVVVKNSQLPSQGVGAAGAATARAVGAMFFPTHIAWATDDQFGNFCRMARTEIGASSPVVSVVHTGFASGWATCRAASDATTWLAFLDSDMPSTLDRAGHVYGVTDNGATVWEIGSVPAPGVSVAGTLVPLGQAELHDAENLWLGTAFGMDGSGGKPNPQQVRAMLSKSSSVSVLPATRRRKHHPAITLPSGVVTVTASGSITFGGTTAPSSPENLLYILDYGIYRTSGTGICALQVIQVTGAVNLLGNQGPTAQFRTGRNSEEEFALAGFAIPGGQVVEFRVTEVGGSASATCAAWVTFAWGPKILQQLL